MFKKIFILSAIFTASLFAKEYSAIGIIQDDSGNPVDGAVVVVSDNIENLDNLDTAYSNSDGSFEITALQLADTSNVVYGVVSKAGFKLKISIQLLMMVSGSEIDFGILKLELATYDTISVAGIVVEKGSNNPIKNAEVGLIDLSGVNVIVPMRGGFTAGFWTDTLTTDNGGEFYTDEFLVQNGSEYSVLYGATASGYKVDSTRTDTAFTADSVYIKIELEKSDTSGVLFSSKSINYKSLISEADNITIHSVNGKMLYAGDIASLKNISKNSKINFSQTLLISYKKGNKILFSTRIVR